MAYAASRYTEVKLEGLCAEIFKNIDKNPVDFVDNYDSTTKEPVLLPVTFPNILLSPNTGIAVGMASSICSFNLAEICDTAIAVINDGSADITTVLKAPDFPTGGQLIYKENEIATIYETGRGSFKVRAVYEYIKSDNCIEVSEIPYNTTVEAIIDKVVEGVKNGKIKEIADIRDESDKSGLKIAIDLKRAVDPELLMAKLFKLTSLEESFSCNFNILVNGMPRVMGIREIINEWCDFRTNAVKRELTYDLAKLKEKLHLLEGLRKILLDIDKAVDIVKNTDDESEVVPNLMIGFGVDEIQAEYIAEIKLRALNREHVLKRLDEIKNLTDEIERISAILGSESKIVNLIVSQLKDIKKKYAKERMTKIIYEDDVVEYSHEEQIEDYNCTIFITNEGYFKKITPASLRMSSEHKLKEQDFVKYTIETSNKCEIIVFTNKQQAYKAKLYDFEDTKASVMGEFLATKLQFESGEHVVGVAVTATYEGSMIFVYENGKIAKVELASYETKTNRKKLANSFSDKSEIKMVLQITDDVELVLESSSGKHLIVNSAMIPIKSTRNTQGVQAMTLRGSHKIVNTAVLSEDILLNRDRYKSKNIPAAGAALEVGEKGIDTEQLGLL